MWGTTTPSGARSTLPRWRGGGGGFAEPWVVRQRSGSGRRREGQALQEEGGRKKAHARFPTQEGCGTYSLHSPHGRHGRGTGHRTTRTHRYEACRPGKHKIMSHVRRLLCSVVWEADAGREHGYTDRTVTPAEAPRLRCWDERSQARQPAGCTRLSGSKAALWAQERHIPRNPAPESAQDPSKGQDQGFLPAGPSPGALPVPHGPTQAGAQPGDGHTETQAVLRPQVD